MAQAELLTKFKRATHVFHTAYIVSNFGMSKLSNELEARDGYNPDGLFIIGERDKVTSERMAWAQMGNDDAVSGMKKDSAFSQIIAHGVINWIYALWNEQYRSKIAIELGIEKNNLMCDVMGDIRILRNIVLHDNAYIDSKGIKELQVLKWVKEGEIVFTSNEMKKLQQSINLMTVYEKSV